MGLAKRFVFLAAVSIGTPVVLPGALCTAQTLSVESTSDSRKPRTTSRAETGAFLLLSQAATSAEGAALVMGGGGYDAARSAGAFELNAEALIWRSLSLRVGAVISTSERASRPTAGVRLQLFHEKSRGFDGAVGVFYKPEGLTEPEGEIETVLSAGTHVGGSYLLANAAYGQDPEGNERDGEVRLAVLRPITERVLVGIDSRMRFDLWARKATRESHDEAAWDAVAGPVVETFIGPICLFVHGGVSGVRIKDASSFGAFAMGGLGASL